MKSDNPMLAIEVSEIGATLIALSVPGVKPLFDRFILRREVSESDTKPDTRSGRQASSGGGTALRSLHLRSGHNMLVEQDTPSDGMKTQVTSRQLRDDQSENSQSGILVQVDFQLKTDGVRRQGH